MRFVSMSAGWRYVRNVTSPVAPSTHLSRRQSSMQWRYFRYKLNISSRTAFRMPSPRLIRTDTIPVQSAVYVRQRRSLSLIRRTNTDCRTAACEAVILQPHCASHAG